MIVARPCATFRSGAFPIDGTIERRKVSSKVFRRYPGQAHHWYYQPFPMPLNITRFVLFRRVLPLVFLVLASPLAAAEVTKINFNLPAGDAGTTLKQFARQAKREIMFPAQEVDSVKTNAVQGEMTVREGLDRLLAGTDLRVFEDRKTGALVVQRANDPNVSRVALEKSGDRPDQNKVEEHKVVLDQVAVTGTRIRGLLGEADFSPVTSFSRKDIERSGMTSVGELSRLIPQAYSTNSYEGMGFGGQAQGPNTTADGSVAVSTNTSRSTINLRGLGTASTLVLVDGRRLPSTGVIRGANASDLSGIPVAAIERIDVLTDGASAIYGSDAVGGVINIILQKHFSGTEVDLSYENTFDSDTAVRTATITHSFNRDKLSLMLSATWQDRHAFAAVDRRFSATDNWASLGGVSTLPAYDVGGFSTTAGVVAVTTGTLPGVGSALAIMPNGATPTNLTQASFTPTTATATLGDRAKYVNLISPQTSRSASFRLGYQLTRNFSLFADGRYSDSITHIEGMPVNYRQSLTVPANYPGNPFGIPVFLRKVFWELGPIQGSKTALEYNGSLSTGVRGLLPHDWRFEAGLDLSRSILQDKDYYGSGLNLTAYNAAIAAQSLVLFYDSRTSQPNSTALLLSLLPDAGSRDKEFSTVWSASADGPVWELPAGPLRLAVGAEHRLDVSITRQNTPENTAVNQATLGDFNNTVASAYAETRVPIVAPQHHIPLVNRLELSSAVRYDQNEKAGSRYSPSFGVQWRPVPWLLVRGTRNNAFLAPVLQATSRPNYPSTRTFTTTTNPPVIDTPRNQVVIGVYPDVNGGNPDLKPQTSVSTNVGLVLESPFKLLQGFSASIDFLDIDYTNQISGLSTTPQAIIDFFPGRLTRGPNLPGDPPGMPGPIIGFDTRPTNIAAVKFQSTDYQLSYHRGTAFGEFDVRAAMTVYRKFESKALPTSTPVDTLFNFPTRLTWQTYWNKGPYGAGVSGFYQEKRYRNAAHTFVASAGTDLLFPSAVEWDIQLAYDFGWRPHRADAEASDRSWDRGLLANTKLSLTVFDVLNREPPHPQANSGFGVTDPRMARYALTLRKSF
ncbi:MAG: hypothetical protein JWM35_1895 [Verrucomicrobia bacterium]|nr:hypothetical protein [Verrucomicrobiota bacterium]